MANIKDSFFKAIGKVPGPIMKMVEEATDEILLNPDYTKIMVVCDAVNSKLEAARDVCLALKKRAAVSNPKVQFYTLVLLESCIKNGGSTFHCELGQADGLRDELVKIALRGGNLELLTARDYARKILLNVRVFERAHPSRARALSLWPAVAGRKGVSFEGVDGEDWSNLLAGVGEHRVANDPRNYSEEPRRPQQQQQQQPQRSGSPGHPESPRAPAQGPPPPAAPGARAAPQPMIMTGPNGEQMLVQPIAPGTHVPGAIQAPAHVQQQMLAQMQHQQHRQQQQQQQHYPHQQHQQQQHHHHQQQHQQHQQQQQQQQHVDPEAQQRREEEQLSKDLNGVPDQIALMNEMLGAAVAEGQAQPAIRADDVISQLAESLRDTQGRVAYILSVGRGGDSLELLLGHNDKLVEVLNYYSAVSGGVGIPEDPLASPPAEQQQQPSAQQPAVAAAAAATAASAVEEEEDEFSALARERTQAPPAEVAPAAPVPAAAAAAATEASAQVSLDDLFAMPPADGAAAPAAAPSAPEVVPAAPVAPQLQPQQQQPAVAAAVVADPTPLQQLVAEDGTQPAPVAPAAAVATPAEETTAAYSPPVQQRPNPFAASPTAATTADAPASETTGDLDFDSFLNEKLPTAE